MRQFSILTYFLAVEVFILFCLFLAIIFHRILLFFRDRKEKRRKEKLSEYFLNQIEKNEPVDLKRFPGRKQWRKTILGVLESFNRRVQGGEWSVVRNSACEVLLLPKARKWAQSFFWLKRNFAARTFALHANPEDEEVIITMIDDAEFLIQSPASLAAIRLESRRGIEKILRKIANEVGYSQFFYRDALLQGSKKVFEIMVELAVNLEIHNTVLDILGAQSWGGAVPFLEKDLNSASAWVRYLALKVLVRNPLPNSLPFFQKGAQDLDPRVRAVALEGFNLFPSDLSWDTLEKGLSDPSWDVRVEAGKLLKQRGGEGIKILQRQSSPIAKEAANYSMQFG